MKKKSNKSAPQFPIRLFVIRGDYFVADKSLADVSVNLKNGDAVAVYELVDVATFERTETLK